MQKSRSSQEYLYVPARRYSKRQRIEASTLQQDLYWLRIFMLTTARGLVDHLSLKNLHSSLSKRLLEIDTEEKSPPSSCLSSYRHEPLSRLLSKFLKSSIFERRSQLESQTSPRRLARLDSSSAKSMQHGHLMI